jgi:cysteine synthase B
MLSLDGELDYTHIDTARKALHRVVLMRNERLALDLRGLTFMDTTGVRFVLQALHRAEECAAGFALIRGPYEVQHVLELVGLTDQLRIVADPSELGPPRGQQAACPAVPPDPPAAVPRRPRPARDLLGAIGTTPLVELEHLAPPGGARLWAKLESLNPTGSVTDRVARALIEDAEARDAIGPGKTILEATTGNTGISLAMICARKGYPLTVVMPDNVTLEHAQMLQMYGAEIVHSPGHRGAHGAVAMARAMADADRSYHMAYQYGNPANPLAHYQGTGPEILREIGDVAAFVAGLGTGGTITGTGRRLREELGPSVKLVAAEPVPGALVHGLRNLEDGFVPPVLDISLLDRRISVSNGDAILWTRRLLEEEGIFAGVSTGAIACVAVRIASELDRGNVVFVVCDDGWKYLSSGVHTRPLDDLKEIESTSWW